LIGILGLGVGVVTEVLVKLEVNKLDNLPQPSNNKATTANEINILGALIFSPNLQI
jgi:hypothetical protein